MDIVTLPSVHCLAWLKGLRKNHLRGEPMDAERRIVVAGVDTHKDAHVLCVLDALGRKILARSFPATAEGYDELAAAIGSPEECLVVGVEGTASYGSGLAKRLAELGYEVREVLRPKREKARRGSQKNDFKDAERAARDAVAGAGASVPKSKDGWVESLRYLMAARTQAVKVSTASINSAKGLLSTAPEPIRAKYAAMRAEAMMSSLARRRCRGDEIEEAIFASLRMLARIWAEAREHADDAEKRIGTILSEHAPALLDAEGCGPISGATLAIAAGDNPDRLKSEASFAALCGVSPVEASSGKVVRHRLNRGGNRQANCAIHRIVVSRMATDDRTRAYVAKRTKEGKSKKEIMRCLKRYVAREVYGILLNPLACADRKENSKLRGIRKSLGLTQAEVASIMMVSTATISRIERGDGVSARLEEQYCKCLETLLQESA